MDKTLEGNLVRKIQRQLGIELAQHGFIHSKPTFYCKPEHDYYLVIHLHKFSFCSGFRIHCALRVASDAFEAIALNGPNSDGSSRYNGNYLDFDETETGIETCVQRMLGYFRDVAVEWFKTASADRMKYVAKMGDPLDEEKYKQTTRKLLGIKN